MWTQQSIFHGFFHPLPTMYHLCLSFQMRNHLTRFLVLCSLGCRQYSCPLNLDTFSIVTLSHTDKQKKNNNNNTITATTNSIFSNCVTRTTSKWDYNKGGKIDLLKMIYYFITIWFQSDYIDKLCILKIFYIWIQRRQHSWYWCCYDGDEEQKKINRYHTWTIPLKTLNWVVRQLKRFLFPQYFWNVPGNQNWEQSKVV